MNDLMTNSFLSYVDLKKQAKIDTETEEPDIELGINVPSDELHLSKFFNEIEVLKSTIEDITNLLFDLQTLNQETKSTHSAKVLRGLRSRMESDMVAVLRKANVVRARLESLESATNEKESSAVGRTRVLVTSGLRAKLKETMNEFQELRDKIVSDHKDYLTRRYFSERGEYPTDEIIESMVSGNELGMEKQERDEAVMDLNKSLKKLHQVFLDMAVLVEGQGEQLNDIEENVAKARSFVSGGTNELFYAKQMKDKKRKSWVCLIWSMVVIIILVCCIAMLSSF